MKILTLDQGSPEWLAARLGIVTASRFADAVKTTKSGRAQVSTDYALALAYERAFGAPADPSPFKSAAMQRGNDLEPVARGWYESRSGELVQSVGFILSDCGRFGYSPDGLVGDDGLIEIKCPGGKQFAHVVINSDPADYEAQCQGGMWISGRKWCDLVVYSDAAGGAGYIQRINRDEAFIAKLSAALEEFDTLVSGYAKTLATKTGAAK